MERTTEILILKSLGQIPSIEVLRAISRSTELKIVFEAAVQHQREAIGASLKEELDGFVVGIHINEPVITICKTITDAEVAENQLFFEKCARDYRALATHLMSELSVIFNFSSEENSQEIPEDLDVAFPEMWERINIIRDEANGSIGDWSYYMHGFHFCFSNVVTKQVIEVSIAHEEEYGVLDPYFFSQYIKSTNQYYPLPTNIYDDYQDGVKIIDEMIKLGRFELLKTEIEDEFAPIVANRE